MRQKLTLDIEFRKNPYTGAYIALEGIDGSGKSTQARLLKEYLESKGKTVTSTFEPNLTLFGHEDILKIYNREKKISGLAFQYLLTANRLINHAEIVEPALKRGEIVISDRCFWSAVVYGGMDTSTEYSEEGAERMLLTQSILSMYHQSIIPDAVYYLHVTAEEGLKRLDTRSEGRKKDIYEKKEKMERVVKGYEWVYGHFPEQLIRIDAGRGIENVYQDLLKHVESSV